MQAQPGCLGANPETLLTTPAAEGASGFVMAERLCATVLTRTPPQRSTAPEREAASPSPDMPQPQPPAEAMPSAIAPAAAQPVASPVPERRRDAAAVARIRALTPLMAAAAQRHDIDPLLLHALAHVESRHQSQAVSPAGALGLMQVMPATGRSMGVARAERELLSPQANLEASARYLKRLQTRFGNDLPLVLAAYNAGEGAVERHGRRVPPYAETQAYVRQVMAVYAELRRRLVPGPGGQA